MNLTIMVLQGQERAGLRNGVAAQPNLKLDAVTPPKKPSS